MSSGAAMYQVNCPQCNFALKVPGAILGKKGQCPKCKAVFLIPGLPAETTEAPAAAAPMTDPFGDSLGGPLGGASADPFGAAPAASSPFGGAPQYGTPQYGAPQTGTPGYAQPANNPWAPPPGAANPGAGIPGAGGAPGMGAWPAPSSTANTGGGFFAAEKKGIGKGVLGGVIMIVIAVVWFVLGLMADRIFFYPPVLLCFGIFAVIKGLIQGNFTGR